LAGDDRLRPTTVSPVDGARAGGEHLAPMFGPTTRLATSVIIIV
jgi:hypothetical protein